MRLLKRASNGNGYTVIGQNVYFIEPNWTLTLLGVLNSLTPYPCRMTDNGITALLVDGSVFGYTIDLTTNAFAVLVDPTGTFGGANFVDYIDTFVIWNLPNTRQFGSSLSNVLDFDGLYTASKTSYPDPLMALIVSRHEILLLGALKSEIWFNAGNPTFPFLQLPGAYIEHGCVAPYSLTTEDINAYWLGQDLQGDGIVFRQKGYDTQAISNYALASAFRSIKAAGGTISDAIGYTYQQDQHVFYVLTFPSADQTWVYDSSIGDPELAWHQRSWRDSDGVLHRERANCAAFINGKTVAGDFENGTIYELDLKYYVDTVDDIDYSIPFIRTFPHMIVGADRQGKQVLGDGKLIQFNKFAADLQCGNGPLDANGDPAMVTLRYSDDRGLSFSSAPLQSSGAPGEFLTQPLWRGLGIARDRVFELEHNIAGEASLNGAWVDARVLNE